MIKLSAKGFLIKEIADILSKSEDTIKTYRKNIIKSLGLSNFTAVVTHTINYGLI
ncbi:MAG: response regulator transcription factor [Bacteroidales bacterium]|nr:response regulator transcription factor [Bacteroidales bacterium]